MSRESKVSLPIVTSDDGTRCGEQCDFIDYGNPRAGEPAQVMCNQFGRIETTYRPDPIRHPACIAAEQAAASAIQHDPNITHDPNADWHGG